MHGLTPHGDEHDVVPAMGVVQGKELKLGGLIPYLLYHALDLARMLERASSGDLREQEVASCRQEWLALYRKPLKTSQGELGVPGP